MAMNMDAALRITAKVDGANNITSLNRSLQTVGSTAKGVTGALVGLTGASAGLSGALGALAPLASIAGLVGLAKGSLDAGDKMFDLAQKTGVSVEALARFKKAASTTGTDIDAVSKALVKLSKGMLDASTGNAAAAAAFKALGVSITDSSGQLKSSDDVMLQVANRFAAMPDGVAKTALALKLFGKAGADMIPMLNMGGTAIDKLSVKMTAAFAEKADQYKDKLTALSGKVGAFGADLLIALLPALNAVTDAVGGAVSAFNSLSAPIKNVAVGGALMAIAWGPLGGLFGTMGKIAVPILANAMTYLAYQTALAGGSLSALSAGLAMVKGAMLAIPGWGWALAGAAALAALLTWVYETNKGFRDLVDSVANVVATDFKAAMNQMGKLASDTGKWIGETWTFLVNDARLTAGEISKAFSSNFGFIAEMADWLSKNVGGKINEMVNAIPKSIRDKLGIGLQSAATGAINALPGGAVSLYALSAMQRAGGAKPAGKEAPKKQPKPGPPPFDPDIAALGDEAAAGKAEKTGRAKKDDAEALARTREGLLLDGMMADLRSDYVKTQRQINDLILDQNTASEAGNALLALQIEGRRVMLESGLEQIKLQDETDRKLAESAKNKDQQSRGLRDQVTLSELNATVEERQEATRFRLAEIDQRIAAQRKKDASELLDLERERAELLAESMARMTELTTRNSLGAGAQQGIQAYVDSIGNLRDAMGQLTTNAIGGLEESLTSLATTGTANFREFAASILKDTTRMIIRQLILKSIMQLIGGIGGSATAKSFEMPSAPFIPSGGYKFADGGAFANGIVPFANGGIVSSPTLFKFAKGGGFNTGLMSESGPEAIMPLRRGADGKLGVASSGGGSTTINVSVDAKGTSVQGDGSQGAALARAIAGAVQTELIKQKRPGGILT